MLENCKQCGYALCDCPPVQTKELPPPPPRHISKLRGEEIALLIEELKSGKIDRPEALRLYKEIQAAMKDELLQIRELTTLIHGKAADKKYSFDDFPLKS